METKCVYLYQYKTQHGHSQRVNPSLVLGVKRKLYTINLTKYQVIKSVSAGYV